MKILRRLNLSRLPFFYGWVIVAIVFVTMAIGVNARTAFSLLFPAILREFGWSRAVTAGAFSFGFLLSGAVSPWLGRLMDKRGPRLVVELGVGLIAAGLMLATLVRHPWQLYITIGMVVCGSVCLGYTGQALYLPNWFVRRRGLAISVAYSGVGFGAVALLPWMQRLIGASGWRSACWTVGLGTLLLLAPINLLLRKRPEELGLTPDGDEAGPSRTRADAGSNIVDREWAGIDWTLGRALRTGRFWWIALAYFCAGYTWYAVQVHQTKYLIDVGFGREAAAWALGWVGLIAVPGQIVLGHLSDRIGRESVWTIGCSGFAVCYLALIALGSTPSPLLLYVLVGAQGLLGYGLTSVLGAIVAEIFDGRHYGAIFGNLILAMTAGGALGPWLTGELHDATGTYVAAFEIALLLALVSAAAIWFAGPRKVRAVAGRQSQIGERSRQTV